MSKIRWTIVSRLVTVTLVMTASVLLLGSPLPVGAGSVLVSNTANAGPMTLRHAIESANNNSGPDVINFDPEVFPGDNPATIALTSALPAVDGGDGITIDGSGAGVIVDGGMLDDGETGLSIVSQGEALSDVTLRSLTVRGFPGDGINICGGGLPDCEHDVTGLELIGVESTTNGGNGVTVTGRAIGDVRLQNCSATMNSEYGVLIESDTDATDIQLISCHSDNNGSWGLYMYSNGSIVDFGLIDSSVSNNVGIGAYIDSVEETVRPRIDNVEATGNSQMGVGFSSAGPLSDLMFVESTIDGNGSLVGNGLGTEVLAFQIIGATVTGNSFSNNIGINPVGGVGFQIYSQFERPDGLMISDNTFNGNVGLGVSIITDTAGRDPGELSVIADNEISGNTSDGVSIYESGPVTISQNRIFGNQRIGINLKGGEDEEDLTAVTPNDPGDADEGSNELLNFPVLSGASSGTVQGTACSGCTVELFESDDDPTGYGEGRTFIAAATASGGSFSIPVSGLCAGDLVTATATDSAGNTSEFSLNFEMPFDVEPCAGELLQGDSDCDGTVTSRDNQALLREVLDQPALSQTEPCPDLGDEVTIGNVQGIWGDWDCDAALTSRDNQALLRAVLQQPPLSQTEPCADIGVTLG